MKYQPLCVGLLELFSFPDELLRVNDDLNNVFLRYERFERYRTGQAGTPDQAPVSPPVSSTDHLPPSYDQVRGVFFGLAYFNVCLKSFCLIPMSKVGEVK